MLGLLVLDQYLFVLEDSITIIAPRLFLILHGVLLLLFPHRQTLSVRFTARRSG